MSSTVILEPMGLQLYRQIFASGRPLTLVMHHRPHLDEAMAAWLIVRYSGASIDLNKSEYWRQGGQTPDGRDWFDHAMEGKILLGCVAGSPFDEHAFDGNDADMNAACAMKVARFLGIENNPEIKAIVDWANRQDLEGGGGPMDVAQLMKTLFRLGRTHEQVLGWAFEAFDAFRVSHGKTLPVRERARLVSANTDDNHDWRLVFQNKDLDSLVAGWVLEQYAPKQLGIKAQRSRFVTHDRMMRSEIFFGTPDGRYNLGNVVEATDDKSLTRLMAERLKVDTLASVKKLILWVEQADHESPLDAANLLPRFITNASNDDEFLKAVNWLYKALDVHGEVSKEYLQAKKQAQAGTGLKVLDAVYGGFEDEGGQRCKVAVIESDSFMMISALRGCKFDGVPPSVIIQVRSSGHVIIGVNKSMLADRLRDIEDTMLDIVTMLREDEAEAAGVQLDSKTLRVDGKCSQQREWFYHRSLCMIFNGSETAPDVPPTKLPLSRIMKIVRKLFDS